MREDPLEVRRGPSAEPPSARLRLTGQDLPPASRPTASGAGGPAAEPPSGPRRLTGQVLPPASRPTARLAQVPTASRPVSPDRAAARARVASRGRDGRDRKSTRLNSSHLVI